MKVRCALLLASFALCASLTAFADSATFANTAGQFMSDTNRTNVTLSGSMLTGITGLSALGIPDCPPATCSGTVGLTSGNKTSGFLLGTQGATFGAGGSLTVTGAGFTFSGTFDNGATWQCAGACTVAGGGTWSFFGTVTGGTLTVGSNTYNIMTAATIQLTTTGKPTAGATGPITWKDAGGTTSFTTPVVAPEPGSLGLVGTGLVGLGALAKRRTASRRAGS